MAAVEVLASLAGVIAAASIAGAARPPSLQARSTAGQPKRVARLRRSSWVGMLPVLRIWGQRFERRLRREADAEVPQLLDLLAAASSAGLGAALALRRAAEALRGPLGDEVRIAIGRVELGGRWRDELTAVSDRLDLPDLRRTVAALTRTETLGSSLSTACVDLAAEVRQSRRARTTERARTAPVKMLFPLVFLVLPAFLLLTVVPVMLTTLQSIR